MNAKIIFNWIKWGLVALVLVILSFKSVHSTGTTEVGVRTIKWSLFSKSGVEDKVYQPGATYFFLPIFNEWETFDARLQIVEMPAAKNKGDKLGVEKKLVAVEHTRDITKKSMIHNGATPDITVDPETYEVTADGELLTCEPAPVLPMAQRYFLF